MTREEAINVINSWVLADRDREALETILPEFKKDKNDKNESMKEAIIDALEKYYISNTVFNGYSKKEMISWIKKQIPPKWLYRLEYKDGTCGLWYNGEGKWCFEQGIGSIEGCKTKDLPMDHDERYKQDGRDWFSSCSRKEDLLHWYSLEDAEELIKKGFVFTRYLATEYHEYENETVFIKDSSLVREEIDIFELFGRGKPKFKKGNWLQYRGAEPFYVEEITEQGYINGDSCLPFEWENEIHVWTIQDAKPGDVLVASDGSVFLYSGEIKENEACYYAALTRYGEVVVSGGKDQWETIEFCYPTTKEQRNHLFQKIKEAGYKWDGKMINRNVKEDIKVILAGSDLSKVTSKFSDMIEWLDRKPEWNEEYIDFLIHTLTTLQSKLVEDSIKTGSSDSLSAYYGEIIGWLKSLPSMKV